VAGARANASMAGRGNEAAGLRWLAEFEAGNRLNSAGGMIDLYNSTPGEVAMWNDDLLDNRRGRGGEVGQIIDQRMQNNPQRDWLGTIGSLVGAAGGAMTGLGNLGFGRRPAVPR